MVKKVVKNKKAEKTIFEEEKYLKIICDSMPVGVVLIDAKTHTIEDVNLTAAKMVGLSRKKMIGSICHKYICPAEKGKCPITDLGQKVDNAERVLLGKGGKKIPILKTAVYITINKNKYLLESFIDITKQKKAEKLFQESGGRFKSIVETIGEQVWEVDENSVYTYMSPMSCKIYGVEPKKVIGKTPFDFMSPKEVRRVKAIFEDIAKSKKSFANLQNTIQNKKNGCSFIVETSGMPFFSSDGKLLGYRGTDRDVTAHIEAEKALNEKIEELKKINRLMVGRELKMIELKKEIAKLTIKINQRRNQKK